MDVPPPRYEDSLDNSAWNTAAARAEHPSEKVQRLILMQAEPGQVSKHGAVCIGKVLNKRHDAVRIPQSTPFQGPDSLINLLTDRIKKQFRKDGPHVNRLTPVMQRKDSTKTVVVDDETWEAGREWLEDGATFFVYWGEVPEGYVEQQAAAKESIQRTSNSKRVRSCVVQQRRCYAEKRSWSANPWCCAFQY